MAHRQEEVEILHELELLPSDIKEESIECDQLTSKLDLNSKLLNVLHINIRSIRKNFNELLVFLETYDLVFCDIIVLTETWQVHDNQFNIDGYTMFYNKGNLNQNDGTVVYIRTGLNFHVNEIKLPLSGVTISKVDLSINNTSFGISCMYRPPSSSTQLFLVDIEEFFSNQTNNQIDIIIGDINIDLSAENDNEVNTYTTVLNHFGFASAINNPTRVRADGGSVLDHIFLKKSLRSDFEYSSYILHSTLTDHYPVMINISCAKNKQTNNNLMTTHVYSRLEYRVFENLIKVQDWSSVLNSDDSELATQRFINILTGILTHSKVQRTYTIRERKKIKPWITNGLVDCIKKKDKMKKKLLLNYNERDKTVFTQYRNNLNKIIQKRKHEYYKQEIERSGNNLKKMYKVISNACNERPSKQDINLEITDSDNVKFTNNKDMADYCNKFFINVGFDMYRNIPNPATAVQINCVTRSSMYLKPTDTNEVIGHINSLKNHCAPGIDGIDSKIVKHFHLYLTVPLVHIINLIFRTGKVPSSFKIAVVTPIHKSGDKTKINNFRPISVINTFAKIFEKCLKNRLVSFFAQNGIISQNQFGFTNGLSTTDAICELSKHVSYNLDNGQKCLAVFLDLAKAFDTVPHESLLEVLSSCGVRGAVLGVFSSYLRDRTQVVKIKDTLSDSLNIKMGVPQGTVLGPILFLAYINSLTNINLENGSVISYADDTAVVFTGSTWTSVKNYTTKGINKIKQWLDSYKLTLNISKTKYVAFSITAMSRPDFNCIHIDNLGDDIKEVDFIKYLGVTIDKHLKWDRHVLNLSQNIRKLIYKFFILREVLSRELLLTVYKTLVESLIRYGLVAWGGLYQNSLTPLNVVQNYILKIIYRRNKRFSSALLYSETILDVRSLFALSTCSFIHKNSKLKIPVNHIYNTRNNLNKHLVIPVNNTSKNLRSLTYLGPKLYNLLPLEIRSLPSLKKFNIKCKLYIAQNIDKFKLVLK